MKFFKPTTEKSIDILRDGLSTQIYTSIIDNTVKDKDDLNGDEIPR